MKKSKNIFGCIGFLLMIPLMPLMFILDFSKHYKPTPLIGRKRGRRNKRY